MKKLLLLVALACRAQILSPIFTTSPSGGFGGFTISAQANSQNAAGALTVTKTTTAGSALLLHGSAANGGSCTLNFIPLPSTASGAETIIPLVLSTGSVLSGLQLVSGGNNYISPSCAVVGCGGSASCSLTFTPSGPITSATITNGGSCTVPATINITDATGTGANVHPTSYCLADGSSSFASSFWYAVNIPGTSSEVFTLSPSLSGNTFNALTVIEVHGAGVSPLDIAVGLGGSSDPITLAAFNTGSANEAVVRPSRVENLGNTWAATTPYTLITGAGQALGSNFISGMSNTYSSTQTGLTPSISTGTTGGRTLACVGFHN